MYASEESSVNVPSGNLKGNEALDGGVAYVGENAALGVHRGVFTGNLAENGGGVFWTEDGGDIEVHIFSTFFSRNCQVGALVRKAGLKCREKTAHPLSGGYFDRTSLNDALTCLVV